MDTVGLRAVKGWVLRAGDQNPVPIDLDSFVEGPPSQDAVNNPLTVLGTGDVAWAAYYDNCVNRLAFYDSLSDLQEGPVSYLVCGWYSNPGQDPLGDQSVHSLTDFNNKMQELQWQLAEGELDESIEHARRYVVAARGFGLESNLYSQTVAYNDALTSAAPKVGYAVSDAPSSMPQFDDNGDALGPYTTDGSWWPNATLMHGCVVALGWPASAGQAMKTVCSPANPVVLPQHRPSTWPWAIRSLRPWPRSSLSTTICPTRRASSKASCSVRSPIWNNPTAARASTHCSRPRRSAPSTAVTPPKPSTFPPCPTHRRPCPIPCSPARVSSPARSQPPTRLIPTSGAAPSIATQSRWVVRQRRSFPNLSRPFAKPPSCRAVSLQ